MLYIFVFRAPEIFYGLETLLRLNLNAIFNLLSFPSAYECMSILCIIRTSEELPCTSVNYCFD